MPGPDVPPMAARRRRSLPVRFGQRECCAKVDPKEGHGRERFVRNLLCVGLPDLRIFLRMLSAAGVGVSQQVDSQGRRANAALTVFMAGLGPHPKYRQPGFSRRVGPLPILILRVLRLALVQSCLHLLLLTARPHRALLTLGARKHPD